MAGRGRPLDAQIQRRAETAYGLQLGHVRVHDGSEGEALAGAHSARAVTVGSDIAFNRGSYRPSASEGQRLLAHELAHVAQQSGAGPRGASTGSHEAAADRAASAMLAGHGARDVLASPVAVGPQCQPLTAKEIEALDAEAVQRRLAANKADREVVVYTEQYQAELAREQTLLESRAHQMADRAKIFREVQEEWAAVSEVVVRLASDVPGRPEAHALNEVRGVSMRLEFDQEYSATLAAGVDERARELEVMAERFSGLRVTHAPTVKFAQMWHDGNPLGESLEQTNERAGTYLAGVGEKHWDKGGWYYLSGAGAYVAAYGVAFIDAAESMASIGVHETATAVSVAYGNGDLSWDDAHDLFWTSAKRAIIIAAITKGVGAATSRIGMAGSRALGLAEGGLAFSVSAGVIAGGLTGATGLGAQAGLTVLLRNYFEGPTARAIWDLGVPTGSQWAIAIPLQMLLGGLVGAKAGGFGAKPIRLGSSRLIGSIVDTPLGKMRIQAITPEGNVVLQPLTATTAPPPPPPTPVDLVFNATTGAWEQAAPTTGALAPVKTPVRTSRPWSTPTSALATKTGAGVNVGESPKVSGPPTPPLLAPPRAVLAPIAGAEEVRMSQAEYEAALNMGHPSQYSSWIARVLDEVGQRAAQRAMANPRFVSAITTGDWRLAGTFFHSAAAAEVRALAPNALPAGWSITAEEVIQSGSGGSRTDVLVRGPSGALMEFDWKTTGSSGLSSGSRSEMAKHAGQIRLHVGGALQTQQTVSWMDYVRPLLSR